MSRCRDGQRRTAGTAGLVVALGLLVAGCSGTGSLQGTVVLLGLSNASGTVVGVSGPVAATQTTGADGRFRFDGLAAGTYLVEARATATREGLVSSVVTVPSSEIATAGMLTFQPVGRISGTVVGPRDAAAPADTVVMVPGTGSVAHPDGSGRFVLDGIPIGVRTVVAAAPDGTRARATSVVVTRGAATAIPPLVLGGAPGVTGDLAGRVVVTGVSDASGIAVALAGPVAGATTTAADGSYAFTKLPPGTYDVAAASAHTQEKRVDVTVAVGPGATQAPDLTLTPVGTVSGTATVGGTTGNAGITVVVRGTGGAAVGYTDDTGHYSVDGAPLGPVTVEATRPGYQVASTPAGPVLWTAPIAAPDLTLVQAAAGPGTLGTFAGTIHLLGETGGAGITARLAGGPSLPATSVASDGTFEIPGVPTGEYSATFTDGTYVDGLPKVLAFPNADAEVLAGGQLYPMPPLVLQRGRRIAAAEFVHDVVVAPDGKTVLVARNPVTDPGGTGGILEVTPISGGPVVELDDRAADTGYQFSPDGSQVYWFDDETPAPPDSGTLHAAPAAGGPIRTVASAVVIASLRFSPDGTHLAFFTLTTTGDPGNLDVAPVAGGQVRSIADHATGGAPVLPASSTSIIYVRHDPTAVHPWVLERIPVDGGSQVDLVDGVTGGVLFASPDGATVYFINNTGELWAVPVAGGKPRVAAKGVDLMDPYRVTPDERRLVAFEPTGFGGAKLESIDLATSDATVLDNQALPGYLMLSPDGRYVIYDHIDRTGDALDAVSVAGGTPRQLAGSGTWADPWAVLGGSRVLVVAGSTSSPNTPRYTGTLSVVALDTGASTTLATRIPEGRPVVLSPDGTHVVFLGYGDPVGPLTAYSVPLGGGGTPVPLVAPAKDLWRSDGQVIVLRSGVTTVPAFRDGLYLTGGN